MTERFLAYPSCFTARKRATLALRLIVTTRSRKPPPEIRKSRKPPRQRNEEEIRCSQFGFWEWYSARSRSQHNSREIYWL